MKLRRLGSAMICAACLGQGSAGLAQCVTISPVVSSNSSGSASLNTVTGVSNVGGGSGSGLSNSTSAGVLFQQNSSSSGSGTTSTGTSNSSSFVGLNIPSNGSSLSNVQGFMGVGMNGVTNSSSLLNSNALTAIVQTEDGFFHTGQFANVSAGGNAFTGLSTSFFPAINGSTSLTQIAYVLSLAGLNNSAFGQVNNLSSNTSSVPTSSLNSSSLNPFATLNSSSLSAASSLANGAFSGGSFSGFGNNVGNNALGVFPFSGFGNNVSGAGLGSLFGLNASQFSQQNFANGFGGTSLNTVGSNGIATAFGSAIGGTSSAVNTYNPFSTGSASNNNNVSSLAAFLELFSPFILSSGGSTEFCFSTNNNSNFNFDTSMRSTQGGAATASGQSSSSI